MFKENKRKCYINIICTQKGQRITVMMTDDNVSVYSYYDRQSI